jgi:hypothetical protein
MSALDVVQAFGEAWADHDLDTALSVVTTWPEMSAESTRSPRSLPT